MQSGVEVGGVLARVDAEDLGARHVLGLVREDRGRLDHPGHG
ncbi:hypothetical protein L083_7072 [Actinoplanes sp. N902-109]|nr:hypothetical protein L083_7072 [Actinoplanes sp. N902-109]